MGPEEYQQRAMEHVEAVYRLSYHLTRRADDAEDLVQETYLRALKPSAVARFTERREDNSGMRSWLMAICHNAFYTSLRKKARAHATTDTFLDASDTESAPGEGCPTWSLADLDWEQVDGSLKRAIDDLKPEFRAVLLLWGVENLKYREIAEILEVPIGTVMSRLHRARALVCEALAADPEAQAAFGIEGDPSASPDAPAANNPSQAPPTMPGARE